MDLFYPLDCLDRTYHAHQFIFSFSFWNKTKVQALSCREDMPLTIKVQGQDVMVVEEFACLPWLSYPLINRKHLWHGRSAITRAAMQSLENQIWMSRLAISTKLKLYNTCILPIFLCGSDCWAISKTDARKIDALDQWCLRIIIIIIIIIMSQFLRRKIKNPQMRRLA